MGSFLNYVGHACRDQGTVRRAYGSSRCFGGGVLARVHRSIWQWPARVPLLSPPGLCTGYPSRRHCQVGSLAGAAHLLKDNAGVLR